MIGLYSVQSGYFVYLTVSIISDVLETWMLKFSENFPKKLRKNMMNFRLRYQRMIER